MSCLRRLLPAVALLLTACASLPPPDKAAISPTPTFAVDDFGLEGRLSLRQGDTSHHVGISWRHESASDEIFLSGPLGQGLAQLSRDRLGAHLLTADQQTVSAADWESLAERAFGMRLPLSRLPQLLAAPVGTTRLDVEGWRIDYLAFEQGRPVLIELQRDDIAARLKIDSWTR